MHIGFFVSIRIPYGWIKESNCLRWARLVGAGVGGIVGGGEGQGVWGVRGVEGCGRMTVERGS